VELRDRKANLGGGRHAIEPPGARQKIKYVFGRHQLGLFIQLQLLTGLVFKFCTDKLGSLNVA